MITEITRSLKMERARQIVLALAGLLYFALLYPLCSDLWHSHWLVDMNTNKTAGGSYCAICGGSEARLRANQLIADAAITSALLDCLLRQRHLRFAELGKRTDLPTPEAAGRRI